jgi:hypothetical protein
VSSEAMRITRAARRASFSDGNSQRECENPLPAMLQNGSDKKKNNFEELSTGGQMRKSRTNPLYTKKRVPASKITIIFIFPNSCRAQQNLACC